VPGVQVQHPPLLSYLILSDGRVPTGPGLVCFPRRSRDFFFPTSDIPLSKDDVFLFAFKRLVLVTNMCQCPSPLPSVPVVSSLIGPSPVDASISAFCLDFSCDGLTP